MYSSEWWCVAVCAVCDMYDRDWPGVADCGVWYVREGLGQCGCAWCVICTALNGGVWLCARYVICTGGTGVLWLCVVCDMYDTDWPGVADGGV